MIAARVYQRGDADSRLQPFGVTKEALQDIVKMVVAARADAVPDDPLSAEGQFAYIFGTRGVRQAFRAAGWIRHREENIEAVRHPDRPLRVVYQSVDLAGSLSHLPRAVSGKGSGADRAIDGAQGSLFPDDAAPVLMAPIDTGVWFFCVSVNGDDVRAELSLPSGISNGNFAGFLERIFIVGQGEWQSLVPAEGEGSEPAEFEPIISRK